MTSIRTTGARTRALLAGALLALVASSCSDGSGGDAATADPDRPTTEVAADGAYDGDDFYAVPYPLPDEPHGTLLRYQVDDQSPVAGTTTYRIMYLSESLAGVPIAVTGTASVPTAEAADGGRDVVSLGHGTAGLADACAPSKLPAIVELDLARAGLGQEALVAQTDYEGLGTPGRHPYLVGESEGRSVLDAAVAAGQLPEAHPGAGLGLAGYSQGGQAVLWAAQLAPEWAPELQLAGTVAGATVSEIDVLLAAAPALPAGYTILTIAGFAAAYPDAVPDLFLTDAGVARLDEVDVGCVGEVIGSLSDVPTSDLIRAEGPASEPWKRLALANRSGTEKTGDAPTLLIHSKVDETVPAAFSDLLLERLCGLGQVVEQRLLATGTHGEAAVPAYEQAFAWLGERFASDDAAPRSSCPT